MGPCLISLSVTVNVLSVRGAKAITIELWIKRSYPLALPPLLITYPTFVLLPAFNGSRKMAIFKKYSGRSVTATVGAGTGVGIGAGVGVGAGIGAVFKIRSCQ